MRFLPLVLLGFLALPGAAVAEAPALPTGIVGVVPVDGSSATALATQAEAPAKPAIVIPSQIDVPLSGRLLSGVGLIVLMALAWLLSSNRRKVPWRLMAWGVGLQLVFALILLRSETGRSTFGAIKDGVNKLLEFTLVGTKFLFGPLMDSGFVIVLHVLTTIIFFSSLLAVLYHLRIMHFVVGGVAAVMRRTLGTSGAESLSAAGNIFVGQTEAPLLIRPFVKDMTMSELMSVMVGGFATVAGGVFAAYVGLFKDTFPDIAGHLLTASVLSAPAALVIAKLMMPEEAVPVTAGRVARMEKSEYTNVIEAAARGAADGLSLMLNVAAMLLAFIALVAMLNFLIGMVGGWFGFEGLSFELILGKVLSPLAWIMGVPWEDAEVVGSLLGTKTVLNEFVAYMQLSGEISQLQPRSVVIATYALCGFANFSSIAIQIGGIGGIAPERRSDLARIGMKAMIGGTLAAFMTATVAGMLL
ncbi:MAG: NupC/NupG family nucleoside CNT transporter [Myxococcales bacterium]|nr:NupC/NupG family nucleoside CNT transporter [Myxococcales bacterium]